MICDYFWTKTQKETTKWTKYLEQKEKRLLVRQLVDRIIVVEMSFEF